MGGHCCRDLMVIWFITVSAISAYHHLCCEFEPCSWQGVLDTTLCDKVCQWLAAGLWFSPGTLVSSTYKTDCHDITEILLKVTLNIITLTPTVISMNYWDFFKIHQNMQFICTNLNELLRIFFLIQVMAVSPMREHLCQFPQYMATVCWAICTLNIYNIVYKIATQSADKRTCCSTLSTQVYRFSKRHLNQTAY